MSPPQGGGELRMTKSYDAGPSRSPKNVVTQLHFYFQFTTPRCVIGDDEVSLKGG